MDLHVRDGGLFCETHAPDIAAMDLFVVPTIGFKLLYGFVIVRIDRRDLVWINVTTNPKAVSVFGFNFVQAMRPQLYYF